MTLIRFMKEKARDIVFDKDPGFRVIAYEQVEHERDVYLYRTIIRELRTGKYFVGNYRVDLKALRKKPVCPFENDDPVFQEVQMDQDGWREK